MPRGQYERKPKVIDFVEAIEVAETIEPETTTDLSTELTEKMNMHARRIWDGQSPDLSLKDRVSRIIVGLAEQGFSTEGLSLPVEGFEKYL